MGSQQPIICSGLCLEDLGDSDVHAVTRANQHLCMTAGTQQHCDDRLAQRVWHDEVVGPAAK